MEAGDIQGASIAGEARDLPSCAMFCSARNELDLCRQCLERAQVHEALKVARKAMASRGSGAGAGCCRRWH